MFLKLLTLFASLLLAICSGDDTKLKLIFTAITSELELYETYIDADILQFSIPKDSKRVVFKLNAVEVKNSFFSCEARNVSFYLKRGSPPVINPEGAKIPRKFLKNAERPPIYSVHLQSNGVYTYINITRPIDGFYYAAVFLSYQNPRYRRIEQEGLTPDCLAFVKTSLYVESLQFDVHMVIPDADVISLVENEEKVVKFVTAPNQTQVMFTITDRACAQLNNLLMALSTEAADDSKRTTFPQFNISETMLILNIEPDTTYYLTFNYGANSTSSNCSIDLSITYVENAEDEFAQLLAPLVGGDRDSELPLRSYELIKESSSESFLYSFDFAPGADGRTPTYLNLTSAEIHVLQFVVLDPTDIGGTLEVVAAFKPKHWKGVKEADANSRSQSNLKIVVCVSYEELSVPNSSGQCVKGSATRNASMLLNATNRNDSISIPYPESGTWHVAFRLFCADCLNCACARNCKDHVKCMSDCVDDDDATCVAQCDQTDYERCAQCDCEDACAEACNSSALFIIVSYPCVEGICGLNGKCVYKISQGLVTTACMCSNAYKGWDCMDDSDADSLARVIISFLLLVCSNVAFVVVARVAYQRNYVIEAIVYAATGFFSTFYHACDAGDNIISFCVVRHEVLQFADFFCGILSIWVTLIAIARLEPQWTAALRMSGAILLACGTEMNKTSLVLFLVPASMGVLIIALNWGYRYKEKQRLPSRRYLRVLLPAGIGVVLCGLLSFALFQTVANYMIVHSCWHVLIATGVIILLPKDSYFPDVGYDE